MVWPDGKPEKRSAGKERRRTSRLFSEGLQLRNRTGSMREQTKEYPARGKDSGGGGGVGRGSGYGSFPAVHSPRRDFSLWRGAFLFAPSLTPFALWAEFPPSINAALAGAFCAASFF